MAQILMYTHGPRAFASALVGHLYELAQEYSVVVLTDPLPAAYRDALDRRDLFPGLEAVVDVRALGFTVRELLQGNRRWLRTVRTALDAYQPSVVVAENDMSSLFDMYLTREASVRGIPTLTIQAMGQPLDSDVRRLMRLWSTYRDDEEPGPIERAWRLLRGSIRRRLGHLLVHYALPWAAGQPALSGPSSYVTFHGAPGMRHSRLHLAQSKSQWRVLVESGVPPSRLGILPHPAARVPRNVFFPDPVGTASAGATGRPRALVLLGSNGTGLSRVDNSFLSVRARRTIRREALDVICRARPGWEILVKAHPTFGDTAAVASYLGSLSNQVDMIDPLRTLEPLLPASRLVLDLPSASSSVLATAAAALPETLVVAADLDQDLLGAVYRDWPGIEHVTSLQELSALLAATATGRYSRRPDGREDSPDAGTAVFATTPDAVRFILGDPGFTGTSRQRVPSGQRSSPLV